MQESEKFYPVIFYPVDKNKVSAAYNQLASPFDAALTSNFGVFYQLNNLTGYSVTLFNSSTNIILGDIFQL